AAHFPLDEGTGLDEFAHNREVYRFSIKWAQEEDRHAHVLFTYRVKAGLDSAAALRRTLAVEGRRLFTLPPQGPAELFTYTLLQEKATQLFYQQFASVVREPVLRRILVVLARDEARHFAFFARVVGAYVERYRGPAVAGMKDVIAHFKMPLATTLTNYWRWALRISEDVGGYDHTAAYEHLVRVVRRYADAGTASRTHDLADFVRRVRGVGP
ncbi:MAG TPA: acyl-ACP desaturase, partial [Methylomirabilota bacterium]|nr:acyl-ACP desaturase [Methylomirabilota bacterium]